MPVLLAEDDAAPAAAVGRMEVTTGVGRRRRWTDEDKARIVAESLDPAIMASVVVRRHELHAKPPALRLAAAAATERVVSCCNWRAGVRAGAD